MILRRCMLALLSTVCALAASAQSYRLVVPAAGDVPGERDTHFRSDISITNLRNVEQRVMLTWLPRVGSGTPVAGRSITIPANGTVVSANFVAEMLGETGLGAIEIVALVDESAEADLGGRLYATSRIWTEQPGGTGTVSQSLPVLPVPGLAHEHVLFTGHRTGPHYRTNLGIVNLLNDVGQAYVVRVSGSVQTIDPVVFGIAVPPQSMIQIPIEWPEDPALRIEVEVLPQEGGGVGTLWTAYVSTVDNATGDSWSTLGVELAP